MRRGKSITRGRVSGDLAAPPHQEDPNVQGLDA